MELIAPTNPLYPFVSSDPERLGGELVFRGSRVPIKSLFDYLKGGETLDCFLEEFEGVSREQALGVLDLAQRGLFDRSQAA